MAKRLSDAAETYALLPETQMGFRGRSTTTALTYILETVRAAWAEGKIVSPLGLGISGAFDQINHTRLLHTMRQKRFPEQIVQFVRSFLSNRQTKMVIPGYMSDYIQVHCGIP